MSNEPRIQYALNAVTTNFTSFVQRLMIEVKFEAIKRRVFHPVFLFLMHWSLIDTAQHLTRIKKNKNVELSEEEEELKTRIFSEIDETPLDIEPKLGQFIELYKEMFPIHIKDLLIESKFELNEIDEDSELYILFFSAAFLLMSKMLFRYKARQSKSISYNQNINESNQHIDKIEVSPQKLISEDFRNVKFIRKTEKYSFFYLPNDVLLKVSVLQDSKEEDKQHLENEHSISNLISHPAIRSSFKLTDYQGNPSILLDFIPGKPLTELMFKKISIKDFLHISREIVSGVLAMHLKHVMHLNLTSEHILFDEESKSVRIIGFGYSKILGETGNFISSQNIKEKDLRYISPEQTDRVKKNIDFRSDLYSLGIVFYKLLTGVYPFDCSNPLELVHMHILKPVVKVHKLNSYIPHAISEMVAKLLSKNAEERYQSAKGIIHDLDLMISEFDNDKHLTNIKLAQHDKAEIIFIPQKQYGREKEMLRILSAFQRTCQNSFEVAFVAGYSGTGKSSLASELYIEAIKENGFFLSGKFDERMAEPFSALLEALKSFCEDLLLQSTWKLEKYQRAIKLAVGEEGKLLTDLIPRLEKIIGIQPCIPEAIGKEAKLRFNYVLLKLFKSICSVGFPIILFLDDLQWCDCESMDFLSAMAVDKSIKNFMLLGTYRENEVDEKHLVSKLLSSLKENKVHFEMIKLGNLNIEQVNMLISDALQLPLFDTYSLSAFIHEKTKGNGFFVHQMIISLKEQNHIFFCSENLIWKWDFLIHQETFVAENVLELLREKILQHDKHTQQALKIASCLGSNFFLSDLKLLISNDTGVDRALKTGMIVPNNGSKDRFRFAHDQIQSAAYSLLPKDPRDIFLYIGKKLWKLLSSQELEKKIFLVINLLTKAMDKVTDEDERFKIASLYFVAGKKALTSTAFEVALQVFNNGINILGPYSCWKINYSFSLLLFDKAAQAAFCCGNEIKMNELIDIISANIKSPLDLIHSKHLQIKMFNEKASYESALTLGISTLDDLGERIDRIASEPVIFREVGAAKKYISDKSNEEIISMHSTQDPLVLSKMMILRTILSTSFFVDHHVCAQIASRMIKITFDHGFSEYSPAGFTAFGSILSGLRDKDSDRFGKLGLASVKRVKTKEVASYGLVMHYSFISPFYSTVHNSFESLLKAYKICLEIGFFEAGLMSADNYVQYAFFVGKNIPALLENIEEFECMKNTPFIKSTHQALLNLLNESADPAVLSGDIFDFNQFYDKSKKDSFLVRVLLLCSIIAYLFHEYEAASIFMERFKPLKQFIIFQYHYPVSVLFDGLISAALARKFHQAENHTKNVRECIKILKSFATESNDYKNKIQLLEAELATLSNNVNLALVKYEEAISFSEKYNFKNEEAIACENAGAFLLQQSYHKKAEELMNQSLRAYKEWGAIAKIDHLYEIYPDVLATNSVAKISDTLEFNRGNSSLVSELTLYSSISANIKKRKCRNY